MADPQTPDPPRQPPVLTKDEIETLREARQSWSRIPPARVETGSSFVDPDLDIKETRGSRPNERYVRVVRSRTQGFEKVAPGWVQATPRAEQPTTGFGKFRRRVRAMLLGAPLATAQLTHERLTKVKALAVLSSDALSSVAYATEQILVYLVPAGVSAYSMSLPIAAAILFLLVIVVLSYRQTIRAYPKGGGSYIVASDNLGRIPGLVAGCALMSSYTMTVSVSVASGADAIISAAPGLAPFRVELSVAFIALLLLGNLRGIKEAGTIFAIPTYLFISAMYLMIGTVLFQIATGAFSTVDIHHDAQLQHATQNLTIVLVLRAFASGASALTGVEAISDGVPAFQPPEWRNARATLTTLGAVLGTMFLGITICTYALGIKAVDVKDPHYQTVISQIAHRAFGAGPLYYYVIVATVSILVLAGNTAFSDFPRLLFFMARDHYAPHQFKRLGDRLAFSNGIVFLGALSSAVVVVFGASVERMIPLYAIGVFTAFTLSQAGMVARWLRLRERGWRPGLAMNALGVLITFTVFLINAVFKFIDGAWFIIALVPVLVSGAMAVHRHYAEVQNEQTTEIPTSPANLKPVCIVPLADLNGVALQSLAMARAISDSVIAVHVSDDQDDIARLRAKWEIWGNHVPLEIVESPYRSFLRPLLAYIDAIDRQRSDDTLVVVLPELVATKWWHQLLHNQTALRLKGALLFRPGTVVINVPYHLQKPHGRRDHVDPEAI